MADVSFTFHGDPTDASRASERVEDKLESLQRQALTTSAALQTVGGGRNSGLARYSSAARDADRDTNRLDRSLGTVVSTMGKVNIQFRFFQNIVSLIRIPALVTAVGLLVQGLSGLVAGLTAVTGALGPVSGLIFALPAGILALVTGLGTLKLAFADVEEALDAQKEGTTVLAQARSDLTDAELKVRDALRNQREALKDAGKGSLEYREATQALRQAKLEERVAEDAVTEARSRGARTAATFARFIDTRLEPALDRLRGTAAARVLPGATGGLEAILGQEGRIRGLVRGAASQVGFGALSLGRLFGEGGQDITTIGRTNSRVLGDMAASAVHLASALRHVLVAGGPFVEWLSNGVRSLASWAERAAFAGRESGDLAGFLERTQESLRLAWGILRPFGAALVNIFRAAAPLGRDIMESLGGAAESFEQWTSSAEGQNRLRSYFENARPVIFEIGRLIRDFTNAFFRLGDSPGFANLLRKLRVDLLPVIERLVAETTAAFGPALVDALTAIARLVGTLAGSSGPLTTFVRAVTAIVNGFTNIIETVPGLRNAIFNVVGVMATLAAIRFVGLITGLGRVIGLTRTLAAVSASAAAATGGIGATVAAGARTARGAPAAVAPVVAPAATAVRTSNAVPIYGPRGQILGYATPGAASAPGTGALAPSRFARFGGAAGAIGGLGAAALGTGIGGTVGNVLVGAGTGAALGSVVAPGIGTAVGGIGGGLLALATSLAPQLLAASNATSAWSSSLDVLGQSMRNNAAAQGELDAANIEAQDATLGLRGAELQLERAQKNRAAVLEAFGRKSLEYREAQYAVRVAQEEVTRSSERATRATETQQREQREAAEASRTFWRELDNTSSSLRKGQREAGEWANVLDQQTLTVERKWIPNAKQQASITADFQARMARLSGVLKNQGKPALAAVADAALILSNRINAIPTSKQIRAEVEFQARFESFTAVETSRLNIPGRAGGRAGGRVGVPDVGGVFNNGLRGATGRFVGEQARRWEAQSSQWRVARLAYAGGGRVGGTRTPADTVPAMLSPGEFVVTGGGEKMLEGMTFPGVLDWLGGVQPAHFQGGGRAQAEERLQRLLDRLGRAAEMLRLRFERLELRQQLAGTDESPGATAARARFIRRRLIPQERREIRQLRREQARARRAGNKELAREIGLEIARNQNELLQLQLEAQEAIRAAAERQADLMAEFGGTIGFEFGGSTERDSILETKVGA